MRNRSHGDGVFRVEDFAACGPDCVFEAGALVFHPENIYLGRNVYVGHGAMLKGYYKNEMHIGDETWIGQNAFLHSAGGLTIGKQVGIGPGVQVLTSQHSEIGNGTPLLNSPLEFAPVSIGDGSDIGANSTILPGVQIGQGALIGAGSVVTSDIPPMVVAYGVPARVARERRGR